MPLPVSYTARVDSGSANNPAVNLTGADAVNLTFVAETDTGGAGDLFLDQPAGGGVDPDTQVEIAGTSYSFTYELSGTLPTLKKDGSQQVPDQYEGSDVVIITVQDYPSAGQTTRFVFMPNETATLADMDAFGNGAIDVQNVDETPTPTPICFLKGSMVMTPGGEVPVEDLKVGDMVLTMDDGLMPVRWISCTLHQWPGAPEKFRPILIPAGALGAGRPHRDLIVSPQHRMLLRGPDVGRMFGSKEVLAPAKGLIGLNGVRWMKGIREAKYYHILLDRHCILKVEGALTESFFPGPMALKMLTSRQRQDVYGHFPDLEANPETGYGQVARRCLSRRETEVFIHRRHKPGKSNAETVGYAHRWAVQSAFAA